MNLILTGPGVNKPDRVATWVSDLFKAGRGGNYFVGATLAELEQTPLKSTMDFDDCAVIFDHYVPGKEELPSTPEEIDTWKNSFFGALNSYLSTHDLIRTDLPGVNMLGTASDSLMTLVCTWKRVKTATVILFVKAFEDIYATFLHSR